MSVDERIGVDTQLYMIQPFLRGRLACCDATEDGLTRLPFSYREKKGLKILVEKGYLHLTIGI